MNIDINKIFMDIDENKHLELLNNMKNVNNVLEQNNQDNQSIIRIMIKIYYDYENYQDAYFLSKTIFLKYLSEVDFNNMIYILKSLIKKNEKYVLEIYKLCDFYLKLNFESNNLLSLICNQIHYLISSKINDFIYNLYAKSPSKTIKNDIINILYIITKPIFYSNKIDNYINFELKIDIDDTSILRYINDNQKTLNITILKLLINKLIEPHNLFKNTNDILQHYNNCLNNIKKLNEILHNIHIFNNLNDLYDFIFHSISYDFCYYGINCKEMYSELNKFYHNLCNAFVKTINHKKTNKIKIGIISYFVIANHSVSNDRIGVINGLIKDDKFDVKIISNNTCGLLYDYVIENKKNLFLFDCSIDDLVKKIMDFDFDIILYPDIGMMSFYQILAMNRLAPIQLNTWGHSETSGIDTIDYFISSIFYEPTNGQDFYTEKLIKLNSLCTYYYERSNKFDINTTITNKYTFCFSKQNNIYCIPATSHKIHPTFIKILQNILQKDPNAIITFMAKKIEFESFMSYLEEIFKENINKLRLIEVMEFPKYMEFLNCVDIVLDTYPFGGCNSTIDAFNVNKIVITMPGDRLNGRFSYGFYKKMDIIEPICNSEMEYVDKAIFYVNNLDERLKIENKIKENKHLLFEEQKSIDDWKNILFSFYNSII
jgi:predicted O-linked N-acetylglucosamine transferase (SPINDLY family)